MKTFNLTLALQLAGVAHLGLICAGLLMPRVVRMRTHLVPLPPFIRQLFWVYYAFIGLSLVSFGVISFAFAGTLAAGGSLARAWCLFLTLFWTLRLVVAAFVFDVSPYLTSGWWRFGYTLANLVFVLLPVVYALAAIHPAWLK